MKWYGTIAFSNQEEGEPDIWEDNTIKRNYYGELVRLSKRDQLQDSNPDITLSNQLVIMADPYLLNSFQNILYVTCNNAKWRVSSVEVNYPRLTLSFGSLYKEDENVR